MLLSLDKIKQHCKQSQLNIEHVDFYGAHYAKTCRIWQENMEKAEAQIYSLGYSDKLYRKWRYYFGVCAGAFAAGHIELVHLTLKKS